MTLGRSFVQQGHQVTVVAQCVDEGRFGRMTHIVRENRPFRPFCRDGVRIVQFRPSRRRRVLLLPLGLELIPLGGRISQRWLRAYSAGYYTAVVGDVLAPLLAPADVVHMLGGEVLAVVAAETARRLGKPVAVSPFAHPGDWGFDSASIRGYRSADVVIATTRADAAIYAGIGVPSARLEIAGLPVPAMVPGPSAALAGLPEGAPLVLFLGARRPTKGVDLLRAAAPAIWARSPATRIAFVGPGDRLGATDQRLLDVGRVSDAERAAWLARATLLCLPSSGESFGLVVAEAWSCRVPVVVSDIPVLRELVEESGGGLLAAREPRALAEAVLSLLDDPPLARRLGEAGHDHWGRNFRPLAVAERHLAIYERLLATREPSAQPAGD